LKHKLERDPLMLYNQHVVQSAGISCAAPAQASPRKTLEPGGDPDNAVKGYAGQVVAGLSRLFAKSIAGLNKVSLAKATSAKLTSRRVQTAAINWQLYSGS
jgi:hypothetical protein